MMLIKSVQTSKEKSNIFQIFSTKSCIEKYSKYKITGNSPLISKLLKILIFFDKSQHCLSYKSAVNLRVTQNYLHTANTHKLENNNLLQISTGWFPFLNKKLSFFDVSDWFRKIKWTEWSRTVTTELQFSRFIVSARISSFPRSRQFW